jgi:DNA-directed RNA polymerase specialized sigma24 family protein
MREVEPEAHRESAGGETFETFFRRLHPQLVRIACRVLGDLEAARDVAQDVLLAAYPRYPEKLSNPSAWVRAAAAPQALNHGYSTSCNRAELQQQRCRGSYPARQKTPP